MKLMIFEQDYCEYEDEDRMTGDEQDQWIDNKKFH